MSEECKPVYIRRTVVVLSSSVVIRAHHRGQYPANGRMERCYIYIGATVTVHSLNYRTRSLNLPYVSFVAFAHESVGSILGFGLVVACGVALGATSYSWVCFSLGERRGCWWCGAMSELLILFTHLSTHRSTVEQVLTFVLYRLSASYTQAKRHPSLQHHPNHHPPPNAHFLLFPIPQEISLVKFHLCLIGSLPVRPQRATMGQHQRDIVGRHQRATAVSRRRATAASRRQATTVQRRTSHHR